jgi:hypothetical protein
VKQQGTHQDEVNYIERFAGRTHRVYERETPGHIKDGIYVLTHNYFLIRLFNATVSPEEII